MLAHYFIYLLEGGRTIQGDVLIKESILNEIVRHLSIKERFLYCILIQLPQSVP